MKSNLVSGLLAALALSACSTAQAPGATEATLRAPRSQTLERFGSEAEFMRYVRQAQQLSLEGRRHYGSGANAQYAQLVCPDGSPPPCDTASDEVVVTGSRIASSPAAAAATITNVQSAGVDEGDIVKQIGRFLIVLQDGRLFVADTAPGGRAGLALAARANVYRTASDDAWYDEMLVSENRIVITGYSYRREASEINVFSINRDSGALTREATYYVSSNDYYDSENYATRLVNGRLVIYTPLAISEIDPRERVRWPLVRRWLRDGDDDTGLSKGEQLFAARDIYRPIQITSDPVIHSISVCPLGSLRAGDELRCQTTAFIGPRRREFFVSPTSAFLWVSQGSEDQEADATCKRGRNGLAVEASVFRLPLYGEAPTALLAHGAPMDQFGLDATNREFRALLTWNSARCLEGVEEAEMRYFHVPLDAFTDTPTEALARSYQETPTPGTRNYETRFTDDYVVYAGRGQWTSYPPGESDGPHTARAVAVPTAQPAAFATLEMPHEVIRAERVGDNIMLSGYRDQTGLSLSIVDLTNRPRIADTRVLAGRYESEGRSHAFNSSVAESGAGLMGLPTVTRPAGAGRWWWRSGASDVSFLSLDANGQMTALGELVASEKGTDPSYVCEVSCVDWYGNSRPIFTDGRVFALSASELIEGVPDGARMHELRRLNLSAPLARQRVAAN